MVPILFVNTGIASELGQIPFDRDIKIYIYILSLMKHLKLYWLLT